MRTLVWITNSFRKNSRLTDTLTGECTFVYYSPYHFAGDAEVNVLKNSNQSNLNWFYYSINKFAENIKSKGFELSVFRKSNPIEHINQLIDQHGYDKVVFDMTQFSIWHNINLDKLNVMADALLKYETIDRPQIDDIMAGAEPREPKGWSDDEPKPKSNKKTSIKGAAEEL